MLLGYKIKINTNLQKAMTEYDSRHFVCNRKKNQLLIEEKKLEIKKLPKEGRSQKLLFYILCNLSSISYVQCVPGVLLWQSNLLSLVFPLCSNLAHLLSLNLFIFFATSEYNVTFRTFFEILFKNLILTNVSFIFLRLIYSFKCVSCSTLHSNIYTLF